MKPSRAHSSSKSIAILFPKCSLSSLRTHLIWARYTDRLREAKDDSSEVVHCLGESNLSIKRDILEQLLKVQKLLIQFENEIRLHSVDKEMMEIVEARHKTKILTLEQKISQLEADYKKAQGQITSLLETKTSNEEEIKQLREELDVLKKASTDRSLNSSPYRTTALSTHFTKESTS